ncbi:hypothetical protein T459_30396 [Capsicum annuum]|uniref:Retroviral polymerase SH3-like domain-containing protein n=1 Tax=Capsicum annuum TaxID=4072 RepID=A0A2G2Y8U1_CAPAN|nr:hypothetical protein T459_30396 [Capsicum annuum]
MPLSQNGYKCYDPNTMKAIVTMDVTFSKSQLFFRTHLQGEKHSEQTWDNKDPHDLTCQKQKDSGFIIDIGYSTFDNNILDKVRDPNSNSENKEIKTIERFHDIINDKDREQTKELQVNIRRNRNKEKETKDSHRNQVSTPQDLTDIQGMEIPTNVQDALNVPEWKEAILEEMNALERNET